MTSHHTPRHPYHIVLIYSLVGGAWIFFSDLLLEWFVSPEYHQTASIAKGWLFILATALLLALLLRQYHLSRLLQERRLREIVDNLPSVLYVFDPQGRAVLLNRAMGRICPGGGDNPTGKSREELGLSPETAAEHHANDMRVIQEGKPLMMEEQNLESDGLHTYLTVKFPLTDTNGSIEAVCGVSTDITDRKRAEEELNAYRYRLEEIVAERTRELEEARLTLLELVASLNQKTEELANANERLQEVDRLKSLFIASMSHELRTPLNSIIGFSSILLNEWVGPLNEEQRLNLSTVLKAGRHLLALINDVIDISKIEAGQVDINPEEFDLYDLCTEAAGILAEEARTKGLVFTVEPIHHAMHTDRRRLFQCFLNLISNAVKYTEQGSVSVVCTHCNRDDERPSRVILTVADTGIGIAPAEQAKIFVPFLRLDSPLKGKVPGTGLGLYLARKIIESILGGQISFISRSQGGSTFTLTVPDRLENAAEQ